MSEPRQKSIGVTPQEKAELEKAKELFDRETGDSSDWGRFLAIASILALTALGVYKLVTAKKSNPVAQCPYCGMELALVHSGSLPPVARVQCPQCSQVLVVDLRH